MFFFKRFFNATFAQLFKTILPARQFSLFMFFRFLCGAVALFITANAVAQDTTRAVSENRFSLSFGPQYNLNGSGIQNAPDGLKTVSAKNTFGGFVGLGYERKTRHGLVFSYDLQYRVQPQEVSVDYKLTNLDPHGSIVLANMGTFSRTWATSFKMLENRFMVGYEHAIGNPKYGLSLQGKVGVSVSHILTSPFGNSNTFATAFYQDDKDPAIKHGSNFIYIENNLDKTTPYNAAPSRISPVGSTLNLYVGVVKKVDKSWLKSVSLGLEGRWSNSSGRADVYVETTDLLNGSPRLKVDRYNSTYRSIGLHLALNFWK